MKPKPFAKGSCQCGNVTISVSKKPTMMLQCHCLDCQKSTGTGHTSNAYFNSDDVSIDGEVKGHTVVADSGNEMSRYFCANCGSRLYGRNSARPGLVSVQVGCLEDHSWFSPQAVFYSSRRNDWDITSDDIPNHPKTA
jgi:hypothetical protein